MKLPTTHMFGIVAALFLSLAACVPPGDGGGGGGSDTGDPATEDTNVMDTDDETADSAGDGTDKDSMDNDAGTVPDTDAGSEGLALEDLSTRLAESNCAALFRCCDESERPAVAGGDLDIDVSDESSCTTDISRAMERFVIPQWEEGVSNGRLAYDPQAAQSCYDSLETVDCSRFPEGNSVEGGDGDCEDFIQAQVELGGTCKLDVECKEGRCATRDSETGTCEAFASEGDSCEGGECGDGLYCDSESSVCEQKKSVGEPCLSPLSCETSVCEDDRSRSDVCESKKSGGEACTRDEVCTSGYCHQNGSQGDESVCLSEPVCDGS